MADWSLPSLSSLYTAWKQLISDRLDDCAKMFDGVSATNLPAGTKKWSASSSKWEKYDGTNWSDMASVYGISISGNAASATTSTLANDSSKLGGQVPSYYQSALGYTPVNKAGDTMTGDLYLYRSAYPTTGVVFLGNTGQRYLYYNGSSYEMPNSELYVYGGMVLRANNAKTINSTSLWGAGNISVQPTLVSGTNIRTINGSSILGSGNLTVGSSINVFAAVSYNSYTNTINRSYNVSSVVDNGTGRFTVNFTTPASSVYYYMSATTLRTTSYPIGVSYASSDRNIPPEVKTTSSCKISVSSVNSTDLYLDAYIVDVVFFY